MTGTEYLHKKCRGWKSQTTAPANWIPSLKRNRVPGYLWHLYTANPTGEGTVPLQGQLVGTAEGSPDAPPVMPAHWGSSLHTWASGKRPAAHSIAARLSTPDLSWTHCCAAGKVVTLASSPISVPSEVQFIDSPTPSRCPGQGHSGHVTDLTLALGTEVPSLCPGSQSCNFQDTAISFPLEPSADFKSRISFLDPSPPADSLLTTQALRIESVHLISTLCRHSCCLFVP